jgi:ankyrin repeat protein
MNIDSNSITKDDFHVRTHHLNTLFNFIKNNKEEQFLEYISVLNKDDIDVNVKDEQGNYLIFFAIIINSKKIVKKLIEYGSRFDILDSEGYSLLYYPIKYGNNDIIEILLEADKKSIGMSLVNIKDARGAVPIFYAIKFKNRLALQELLSNNADANYKNVDNVNALHMAVLKKDPTMVRMLVRYIKNINTSTNQGSTALHYATNFQQYEITKILLENGANPNIIEFEYDFYPIFFSVIQNNTDITKLLIEAGTNINHQDYQGNTIIHYSIEYNHYAILNDIFNYYSIRSRKDNVYFEDINTKTENSISIDPNIINIDGLSIVHLLMYSYREEYDVYLTKLLPETNLNYQDNIGNTVLHIMVEKNQWAKFIPILDNKKLNIYIKNNRGKTVFDMVRIRDRDQFIDLVAQSYYRYLRKYENQWLDEWQNKCSAGTDIENDCISMIKQSIMKGVSVPSRKNRITIIIDSGEVVQFTTFTGSLLDMIVGFKYLTLKYDNVATTLQLTSEYNTELEKYYQSIGIEENPHQFIVHFEIRWIYQRIFFPPNFESIFMSIINNPRYKYIIIPIGIILSNGNHSNCLIYNIEKATLERFEPHGSDYPTQFNYNPDLLDEVIYKKINNLVFRSSKIRIKYYKPINYLPKIGFQKFENAEITINKNIGDPNGFCTLWCIWYLDYRIKYIDKKPYKIVDNLIREIKINNYSFRNIIRNYSKNITDLRDQYLAKVGFNINDYLNNKMNKSDLRKLLLVILSPDD